MKFDISTKLAYTLLNRITKSYKYLFFMSSKRKSRVTGHDVAKEAGVSQATVSFVFNDVKKANISEATRQRVLQTARRMGYTPDKAAKALRMGVSNNLGLILVRPHKSGLNDHYIPNIVTGIADVIELHNFRILLETIQDPVHLSKLEDLVRSNEVAGLIVVLYERQATDISPLKEIAKSGFPIVTAHYVDSEIPSVSADSEQGVRLAMSHLLNLGHRQIACIPFAPPPITDHIAPTTMTHRLSVYQEVLEESGIEFDPNMVEYGDYSPESGFMAMTKLLENATPPTAVFAMNDVMALGAIGAIHESGLRVPKDIAIVGYDNIPFSRYAVPPLTTIDTSEPALGKHAGEIITKLLHGEKLESYHIRLETELIVRVSCGANEIWK